MGAIYFQARIWAPYTFRRGFGRHILSGVDLGAIILMARIFLEGDESITARLNFPVTRFGLVIPSSESLASRSHKLQIRSGACAERSEVLRMTN